MMGDGRPYLEVEVMGKTVKGLLDSGAEMTIVGEGLADWVSKHLQVDWTGKGQVQTIDATRHSAGKVVLPIQLGDTVVKIAAGVVPVMKQALVLGIDFWNLVGLKIAWGCKAGTGVSPKKTAQQAPSVASVTAAHELDPAQKQQLEKVKRRLANLVQAEGDILQATPVLKHEIRVVPATKPIRQRNHLWSPIVQKALEEELDKMLASDVVEPSRSPWSSPVVMTKKGDGRYRFCFDGRKLNEVTARDSFPTHHLNGTLDKLRRVRFISRIDLKSAFWQIELEEDSREKTAFAVPKRGLFQFKRMPYGLHNSSATFCRLMDMVLGPELEPYVLVYLDDVVVLTETFEDHVRVLDLVVDRLQKAKLTVNMDKVELCQPSLKYLGHYVDKDGLRVDPDKVQCIAEYPAPRTVRQVRRFIGMVSFYRRFIPEFSRVCAPLTKLTGKRAKFIWADECEEAFVQLKGKLMTAPILVAPDFTRMFTLQTDASNEAVSGVLTQEHEDGEHVICYFSKILNTQQKKYSATEKELLAIVLSVEKFRPYLEGYHFKVITDHHSLKWIHSLKDPVARLARWSMILSQYDMEIEHRKGSLHKVPDAISRAVPIAALSVDDVEDPWYLLMIRRVQEQPGKYPDWKVEDGRLFKMGDSWDRFMKEWKQVVPAERRSEVLDRCHDQPTAAHMGMYRTYHRVAEDFYWPRMRHDIYKYVSQCPICQKHKTSTSGQQGKMSSHVVSRVFQLVSVDLSGPYPRSRNQSKFLLAAQDVFSGWVMLFPLADATAAKVVKCIKEGVILRYGAPEALITDNGGQFTSKLFKDLMAAHGIKAFFTTPYHPQANPVERQHAVLKSAMASYCQGHHQKWDAHLKEIEFAINTSISEPREASPASLFFNHRMVIAHEFPPESCPGGIEPSSQSRESREALAEAWRERVKVLLEKAQGRSKARYDQSHKDVSFAEGDLVKKKTHTLSSAINKLSAKLAEKYDGPFKVKEKVSDTVYVLEGMHGESMGRWHVNELRPWRSQD